MPWLNTTEVLWDESTCRRVDPDPAPSPTEDPGTWPCLGCPEEAEVNQTIVDFALSKLSFGECQKNNINVANFKKQVLNISYLVAMILLICFVRLFLVSATVLTSSLLEDVDNPIMRSPRATWRSTPCHGKTRPRSSGTSPRVSGGMLSPQQSELRRMRRWTRPLWTSP